MKKLVLVVLILVILPLVSSQYIYGDIYVNEAGESVFRIESNVDPGIEGISFDGERARGITSMLTSKEAGIWTFSLNLGRYEEILVDVHLPKSLKSIKAIEGVDRAIDFDERIISLIDENTDLYFEVEYELGDDNDYFWIYFLIVVFLAAAVVYFLFRFTKRKRKLKGAFPYLGDNEEKIIKLLMKGAMRQKETRKKLNIPKASFTRYIINLEKKKLLIREGDGKNKVLRLR